MKNLVLIFGIICITGAVKQKDQDISNLKDINLISENDSNLLDISAQTESTIKLEIEGKSEI